MTEGKDRVLLLDHGYLKPIESWGSDERIVEAARMSTDKGFIGWGPLPCPQCTDGTVTLKKSAGWLGEGKGEAGEHTLQCPRCLGKQEVPGDEKLLAYLWQHRHTTPFEMAGLVIEVQAPIFVFREWHRHRTQSYNELSARYTPLPDLNYLPSRERVIEGAKASANRQAAGTNPLLREAIGDWQQAVAAAYEALENTYQTGLSLGIPKELARVIIPVGRYSRMRASANLWNWLHFLTLRMDQHAQWEIRQYANAVGEIIAQAFPRTWELFKP
jgi:thymidylate synthase (FAD)